MTLSIIMAALLPVIPQPNEIPAGAPLGDEGYRLEMKDGFVTVFAGTPEGRIWGKVTADQLKARGVKDITLTDAPKWPVRGLVFDVARRFIPMTTLYKVVDRMSYYKLNTLQVHLNDNEICKNPKTDWSKKYAAFRLQCDTCPELTAKDGSYTKDEFRAFMKYARTKGVTVIPEIDVPAHSLAFTRARPEFASHRYGEDHFDLDKTDAILAWLEPIFREYFCGDDPVFAGPYCHVGTDEYNKAESEKFRAFSDRMLRMVRSYGYIPCAWGALTHAAGTTPVLADRGIVIDIWHNPYYQPDEALKAGYSIVSIPDGFVYIVPKAGYYYDFLDNRRLYEHWAPNVIGSRTFPEDQPGLVGGKYAIWNDMLDKASVEDNEARIFAAMPVIAQKCWSGSVPGESWEYFEKLCK